MEQFATLNFPSVLSSMMSNKIKTAIHNETAKALSASGYDIEKVKNSILNSEKGGYCCAYALALLSSGEERKDFLKKCIADSDNIYGVGASLLRELYLQSETGEEKSIFDELIAIAKNKPSNVLLGNRYVGKSLAMILSALNLPAVCFCDDEREGYDYDGLHTRRADDVLTKGENYSLIVCVRGKLNRQIMSAVRPFADNMPIITLKDTTYKELSRTADLENLGVHICDLADKVAANFDDNAIKKILRVE